MADYKNLRIKADTFEMLKRNKPDGVTWNRYLETLQYATDKEEFERPGINYVADDYRECEDCYIHDGGAVIQVDLCEEHHGANNNE